MEDRLGREEIQSAAGHLRAELDNAWEEFRRGRMPLHEYRQKAAVIHKAAQRFKREFVVGRSAERFDRERAAVLAVLLD